jgi:23S rRNA (uracil1939-C5)-methyltransferase
VRVARERAPREEGSELIAPAPRPAGPPPGAVLAGMDEATLRIEKLVAGGEGLGRIDGVPLFVPRSAPGDLVRVRIVERHPDYGRAEIEKILEAGPGRRPDPVPELSRAGICDLQHLKDELQPRLKATAVREALERLGGLRLPEDLEVVTGEPWGYRLRTQLHTEIDPVGGGVRVGYHARGTNEVIPLSRCPLLVPELEAVLADLPGLLGLLEGNPPKRIDLTAGDPGAGITTSPAIEGLPQGEVTLTVGDIVYAYDARTFFQGHRGLLPRLVDAVVGPWEGEAAYDLYAGVGLFTLPLARRYKKVVAVESDTTAVRYGRNNARRNKITNVDLVSKVVESWLPGLPTGVDRVVVDPPRAGLTPRVRKTLVDRVPKRLTYVSCHPAALARDLKILGAVYAIEKITLFDLFPQTGHMETVVQLVAKPQLPESSGE